MTAAEFIAAMTEPVPAPRGAVCVRCRTWTYAPVPVRHIERQSGPGVTLYACPTHAVDLWAGPTPGDELRAP
ncbi:hypothetical protein [Streptomyces sp. NPDC004042]|uniref:hypothetical protein n=1 Tax=Streptomyces sp. NPDC004042 TaxID=3154451 RepID=UPI0033A8AAC1